jgi:acetolactate synthase-1/2/3 large subunit
MKNALGGDIIARMLHAEGVDHLFGIIDGTYFGLYSSLGKYGIQLITPRHETSAAHMAGAYARATGRVGVCIASNGPGMGNILPGVAVENAEGNRVLLITSCRRDGLSYPERAGAYQSFDQVAVTRPMTKWSVAVTARERIPELLQRALREVHTGRPGVVHVDVPESIMNGKGRFDGDSLPPPARYRATQPLPPSPQLVEEALSLLDGARRPILQVGSGVIHARAFAALASVATRLGVPVTTSWGARGALPETHPSAIPMVHLKANDRVRGEADLVLAIGTRFGETDWWGRAPHWASASTQKVIQVDLDAASLGLNKPIDLAIQADAGAFLEALDRALAADETIAKRAPERREWLQAMRAECDSDRSELDKRLKPGNGGVNPGMVPRIAQEILPENTLWVFDGGNTAVWAQFFHQVRQPNSLFTTFKFGMLGAGVAQAIGARAAYPDRVVCTLIGDGAFGFHLQEIETAVRHDLPAIYVVFCDRQWGMVKMNQQFALKPVKTMIKKSLPDSETINANLGEIRFDQVARAMGGHGEYVLVVDELRPALERSLASGRVSVIHVEIDPVTHMWAPGLLKFKEMHQEPKKG